MREEAGDDVGDEHRRQGEQHVLDTPEAALDDEGRHQGRSERHADVSRHAGQVEARCDTGELRSSGADVRGHEHGRVCGSVRPRETVATEGVTPFDGEAWRAQPAAASLV